MSFLVQQSAKARHRHLAVGALFLVCACSSGGDDGAGSGGSGSGGSSAFGGSSASGGSGGTGAASSSGGTGGSECSRFDFFASGTECPSTGCGSISCDCEGQGFPVSITSCSADGCLTAGNCEAMCSAELSEIFACTDTYTTTPGGTGGTTGGTGGTTGGTGGTVASCDADQVSESPEAVKPLSESLVNAVRAITDDDGNLYVAGHVSPSTALDFGDGDHADLTEKGRLFLLKLDAAGNHVWSRRFGTNDLTWPERIATLKFAANGDLLLGGSTGPETDLGGGPEPSSLPPQHFVARYSESGTFVRSYLLPTNDYKPELVSVVELPSGELLFWGRFDHPFTVGATTLTPAGTMDRDDIYVVRFSEDGEEILEAKQYGGTLDDTLFDVVADASGNSYLVGAGYNQLSFGEEPLDLGSGGMSFAVALGPTLSLLWQKTIDGPGQTYPRRALVNGTELVVGGDTFGDGDLQYDSTPFGMGRIFVLRMGLADGSLVQGDAYTSQSSSGKLHALGIASDGDALLGGWVNPPADFGGSEATTPFMNQAFLARFGDDGAHVWSTVFCTAKNAQVVAVAQGDNSPVAILQFSGGGTLELGNSQITQGGSFLLDMPEGK